jgi:hypothetical protein
MNTNFNVNFQEIMLFRTDNSIQQVFTRQKTDCKVNFPYIYSNQKLYSTITT